jgi:hypothetical protein
MDHGKKEHEKKDGMTPHVPVQGTVPPAHETHVGAPKDGAMPMAPVDPAKVHTART